MLKLNYIRGVSARGLLLYQVFRVEWTEALDSLEESLETYEGAQFVEIVRLPAVGTGWQQVSF